MGKINATIRSLLYQAKLHHSMWDYAVEHAVWLKNRLPTSALPYGAYFDAATPFQAYHGHKPDLESLRIFGCAAHSVNIHGHSLTYDPKILDEHIFVGMKGNRIWRLLNRHTKKELLTTDVKFNEYLFPKLTDVTDEAVVPVPQNTRSSQPSMPAPALTTRSLPGQQGTRPGNTESDIQLHEANEQEALPPTTGSRNDRLSSSRTGR